MMESEESIDDVLEKLAELAPGPADAPRPPAEALARFQSRSHRQPLLTTRRSNLMTKHQYTWATALLLLLFMAAFAFPGVRAAASDLLGVFRVQKFAPISISPRQLAMLEQLAGQGFYPGQFELLQEPGPAQPVGSPAEAEARLRLPVRTLTTLGEPQSIWWAEGGRGRLTVDLAQARTLLNAAGVDPALLPDSLEGAQIDVTLFGNVNQNWDNGVSLMQTESPAINYPPDVDPAVIGEALLQLLGLAPGEARRLARSIDWTNTLLLPIPENMATFGEVRVDGVTALAISTIRGQESTLMWQKGGIVYVLHGSENVDELVRLANSLR
jgi:hypothetical protein